jgi:hypothetical protein
MCLHTLLQVYVPVGLIKQHVSSCSRHTPHAVRLTNIWTRTALAAKKHSTVHSHTAQADSGFKQMCSVPCPNSSLLVPECRHSKLPKWCMRTW